MFKNIFRHIKSGMSLIELLVVITIIGILIGVLVPTIGNTQGRTRDVTRQTQVQELAAALMSYKLDNGEFPIISEIIYEGETPYPQYWGDIGKLGVLVTGGYIKKISKDPTNLSLSHTITESERFSYTSNGYYLYLSDGKSFMIIAPVEDEKNGNSSNNQADIVYILQRIGTDADKYVDFFDHSETLNGGGNLYIYKYKEEIL